MAGFVKETNQKNMKSIAEAAAGNVELQTLLLRAISQYREQKTTGEFDLNPAKKARKGWVGFDDKVRDMMEKTLNRNQAVLSKWSVDMLKVLIAHGAYGDLPWDWINTLNAKDRLLEVVEFLWDLRVVSSSKPDKVSSLECGTYLPRMRTAYFELGNRGKLIAEHPLDPGHIDWRKAGHYTVAVLDALPDGTPERFEVFCKILNQRAIVDPAVTRGDSTMKTVVIKQNFSLTAAFLQTVSDTYNISFFFPRLSRSLRKRNSNENHTAGKVPGGAEVNFAADADVASEGVAESSRASVASEVAAPSSVVADAPISRVEDADDDVPPSPT